MWSRWVVLVVLVLFGSSALIAQGAPAKKAAEKGKPAQAKTARPAKPAVQVGPVQAVPPEAIARALEQPIDMEFIDTPLADVVEYIEARAKIPVLLDRKALDEVGVQPDVPITINLKGFKLRAALGHLLRALDLAWIIRDDALVMTTREQADAAVRTRVYEVADLVAVRDEQLRPGNDFDSLIDVITSTVKPSTWDEVGGPGSITGFQAAGITALVVSQTQDAHEDLDGLLAELRKLKKGNAEPPIRTSTPTFGMGSGAMSGGGGGGNGKFMGGMAPPGPPPKPPAA